MRTSLQFDQFHVVLLRENAAELLLKHSPRGAGLPVLNIPANTRTAEELTHAVRDCWGLGAYCLLTLPIEDYTGRAAILEVTVPSEQIPLELQWHSIASLRLTDFDDATNFAAMEQSLRFLNRYRHGELPGNFAKPGCFQALTDWVNEQAKERGLRLNSKFRQLNAGPSFSLLRFETDGPGLWFKAVGEPNLHEYRITLKLASLFPEFLPRILGTQPHWNAWLALESEGCRLDANSTEDAWAVAAENLALLQISSFDRRFEFVDAGCKDLRACCLVDLVDPFLEAITTLMEWQRKPSPAPLSREQLRSLGRDITWALKEFGESIPSTLGHLDLNPGNILVSPPHCVFLDWAEAYIGPPFFSLQYLREHLRTLHGASSNHEKSLVASYAKHWTRFASPTEVAAVLEAMPLLAAFAFAVASGTWRNPESVHPEIAALLRSLTRRMKHEADRLQVPGRRRTEMSQVRG